MTIRSFKDGATKEIHDGIPSKRARGLLPIQLHGRARIKLARLDAAGCMHDLQSLRGNRFEFLAGDRAGQMSIRINRQYRICFRWDGKDAFDVEIVDYRR